MSGDAHRRLGRAWVWLTLALFAHVVDETLTNFLVVYNPTAIAIRERLPWLPLPVFQFETWFLALHAGVLLMAAASIFAYRNAGWFRPIMWALALLMLLNGLGHLAGTIAGRTLSGLTFSRPMPGTWSSPLLIAAALYLMGALRAGATATQPPKAAAHAARS